MTSESNDPLLEFLGDPAIVLRRKGEILQANAGARQLLGPDWRSRNIFDFVLSPRDDFDRYLSLCSGTTAPMVGAVVFRNGNAGVKERVVCARLRGAEAEPRLGLRCLPKQRDEFSLLTKRLRELKLQLRERLHEKALLEEALDQKTVLMRELQHRVKNNIQMMMSLITMSANGKESPQLDSFIDVAQLRLQAMASAQEAIYRSQSANVVKTKPFLETLVQTIIRGIAPKKAELQLQIVDADLSNHTAHALSLIINELVTNAAKHGLQNGAGTVVVTLERVGSDLELTVRDSGPGIAPDATKRSSGLRLVRGLCRQIGATFDLRAEGGTRCTIRFGED